MNLFSEIKAALFPEPQSLQTLATGLCVLPMPRQRYEAPKQETPADMYVIDQDKNEFGFHSATAQRQNNGGIPTLTGYDVTLLKERELWGTAKNKILHGKNATCKKCWHGGKSEKEAGVILGKSESWVEKRYGTFSSALLIEVEETGIPAQTVAGKS